MDNSFSVNNHSQGFLGSQLVDWLLDVGLVADRITAVHYGNSLLRGRVIRHSENRYYFRDSNLTYEFCPGWDGDVNEERSSKWHQGLIDARHLLASSECHLEKTSDVFNIRVHILYNYLSPSPVIQLCIVSPSSWTGKPLSRNMDLGGATSIGVIFATHSARNFQIIMGS
jgi:hypothetical protein